MEFVDNISDDEQVTQYLNCCALAQEASEKVSYFFKIQEILLRKTPILLPKFLQNILNFTTERNPDIKKALVGFIEELIKVRESYIPKVMLHLHMLLCDESVAVQKRVIQAAITIYRRTLSWLCMASITTDEMEEAWKQLSAIKLEIANMIDSDNDGIRTSSVKFLECVVLLQTYPDETESRRPNDFSLDDVPLTLKVARRRHLEEEASNLFEVLVKFHGSPHISSANLLACIGALTNIAKSRAEFMVRVVNALESLFNNLPPTLTTTQVSSVKKKLKTELCSLLKHPAAYEYVDQISPILSELGCSQSEINKLIPKSDERKKYKKRTLSSESLVQKSVKRARLDHNSFDIDESTDSQLTPLEANEQFILENLTLEKAVYLIFTNIPKLPNTVPTDFIKDYAEFVNLGNIGKIHLANVLAKQFTQANVGPGKKIAEKLKSLEQSKKRSRESEDNKDEREKPPPKKEKVKVLRIKTLKLAEITKPLEKDVKERLMLKAVERLLTPHRSANKQLHQKIITTMATCFNLGVRDTVLKFLLNDLRSYVDIALSWLFEEYSIMQGFSRIPPLRRDVKLDDSYNFLLCSFINVSATDALILSRLLLEAPSITDDALEEVRAVCRDERRSGWALGLLRDLTVRKPPKQLVFLNALLSYTTYESNAVRDSAIGHVLELHKRFDLRLVIEEFARMNMEFLKLPKPPESLCGINQGRLKSESWGDDFIKACLLPYVSLLPVNESLIHDLAKVYVQTSADIKRIILRLIEVPIKTMGMGSAELLKLVEECPKGSETLVTRVIHILTDKANPTPDLVNRVRDLYNSRISDVRFLIPVLNGLSKQEIISALPKLIKLNPVVVREVFNRLLGLHGDSPISPTELLVSLHLIDSTKADLKTVIKATSMCLQERQVFTQEVLAVVLQQLMDQSPLPTLLMRTVIQALGTYPRLSGFIMNILQRLILKKVWKQKVVWEGFVKCCQRTKPQSFAVLMQLPPQQLEEALTICADLQGPLREHLLTFTEAQRSHIPQAVQEVVLGSVTVPPPVAMVPPPVILPQPDVVMVEEQPIVTMPPPQSEPLPPGMD
ncbi:symplekin scaffold protein [Leptinotarsa decemlineata]|uniref:symplekin scaffold protein n=1 Tax=Leptinotarsa decemlineata TaxID=7539 RepID=UPI003D30AEC2